ncbi:hypothetical protein [Apilactobacillus quenuiae]|uniref:hypothetical protein n=1 Tax=Apilactobacillus quenuiae TaxID=2008377 RepID=UPI000D01AE31|nr:hypothetical protein [Apilactobacillus quenuiae]
MKNNTDNLTREAYKKQMQDSRNNYENKESKQNVEYKNDGLKRKLNWTIFLLILGIIIVYLILFFFNP